MTSIRHSKNRRISGSAIQGHVIVKSIRNTGRGPLGRPEEALTSVFGIQMWLNLNDDKGFF